MSVSLDLTGLNLEPISLKRSEMSEAMVILDDLLRNCNETNAPTTNKERQPLDDSSTTSASTESSFADIQHEIDHLSVARFQDFDHDYLEPINTTNDNDDNGSGKNSINNIDSDNSSNTYKGKSRPNSDGVKEPMLYSLSPLCSYPSGGAPHHDSRPAGSDPLSSVVANYGSFQACPCPPTSIRNTNKKRKNDRDKDALSSPDLPPSKRHKAQPILEQRVPADHRDPSCRLPRNSVIHLQGQIPSYYSAAFAASTTATSSSTATNSHHLMHSTHRTTTNTASHTTKSFSKPTQQQMMTVPTHHSFEELKLMFGSNRGVAAESPSQQKQPQSHQPSFAVTKPNRPVASLAINDMIGAPPQVATDSRSIVVPPSQPQEQQPNRKQKESSKDANKSMAHTSPASESDSIASKESSSIKDTSKDDQKTSIHKTEPHLKPIHHEKWQRQLDDLLEFKKEHGHCLVPIAYSKVPTLPHWIKRQRNQYKKKLNGEESTLTDERQQILDDAGFVWDSHQALWKARLDECRAFRDEHGHCSIPARYSANMVLAVWAKCQRRLFRVHKKGGRPSLTVERINDLNGVGFVWDPLSFPSQGS